MMPEHESVPAFAPRPSGILVPPERVRDREVWIREEWKALQRAGRAALSHKLLLVLICEACEQSVERIEGLEGIVLRCKCKDRVVRMG